MKTLPLARSRPVTTTSTPSRPSRTSRASRSSSSSSARPAGEIQAELDVPGPTLSHHLDLLRRAGLVQSRREERFVYYSTRPDTVSELVRLLTACC